MDADRLEGAGCRVLLVMRLVAQCPTNDAGKLTGALQRASLHDRAGHPARARLLAIAIEDVGNLLLRGIVQEIGGTHPALAHRHGEGAVRLKGKAALRPVELHRGHADVERHACDGIDAPISQQLLHPGKFPGDKGDTLLRRQRLAFPNGIGIAVEGKNLRALRRHRTGIAARAERAIHMNLAGVDGEGMKHFIEQNRDVTIQIGRSGHLPSPAIRWSSQRRTLLRINSGRSLLSTSVSGFQIWM